jgi:hypothetical protein
MHGARERHRKTLGGVGGHGGMADSQFPEAFAFGRQICHVETHDNLRRRRQTPSAFVIHHSSFTEAGLLARYCNPTTHDPAKSPTTSTACAAEVYRQRRLKNANGCCSTTRKNSPTMCPAGTRVTVLT